VRLEQVETLASDDPTRHNTVAEPDAVRRVATPLGAAAGTDHVLRLAPGSVNVVRARVA
jgi:hypothetical protein